jgi:phospholipid-transporting ATPase
LSLLSRETAPKNKNAARIEVGNSLEVLSALQGKVYCSKPIAKFTGFEGKLAITSQGIEKQVGLSDENLVLRGSKVDNTEFVFVLVYSTGRDTKLMLNRSSVAYKFSSFERRLNLGVFCAFSVQFAINLTFSFANSSITTFVELERNYWLNVFYEFVTSFILFSYLIPLSLYVTIEFVRVGQGLLISSDLELSTVVYEYEQIEDEQDDEKPDAEILQRARSFDRRESGSRMKPLAKKIPVRKKCVVKTTDITDELGMVEYVLSDKTGTLTKNKMELKAGFVDGLEVLNSIMFPNLIEEHERYVQDHKEDVSISRDVEGIDSMISALFCGNEGLLKKLQESTYSRSSDLESLKDWIFNLLVCNDIVVSVNQGEADPSQSFLYQSLSPDEIAFAEALSRNGAVLVQSTDKVKEIRIQDAPVDSRKFRFIVHGMLHFSADRKRMSIVVETLQGEYKLFIKGADSKLRTFLASTHVNMQNLASTDAYLSRYASSGYRTLLYVSKTLSPEQFQVWKKEFEEASLSLNRERKIEVAFERIEQEMTLLGCSAVEDPLQDGVPEAVESLINAGIHVVVLTGDKKETAVAISRQARIVGSQTELLSIDTESKEGVENAIKESIKSCSSLPETRHALVITGNSLEIALQEMPELFLELLQLVETVVCARATPSQKAGMVINIKKKLGKTCLAIGDGANDVSMIQKANVGVGLTGKEGSQAAQASDFVLHRFRHLPRLLFVHGRFAYIRICKVVYWSFYKNTLFPFPLFLYGIFSGWSSQPLYDALIMNLFNVLLTSLPPLVGGWVEKDAREAVLLKHPETYSEFRESRQFSIKVFMSWVLLGITQSLVIFWFAFGVFYDIDVIKQDGKTVGIFTFGSWQCTAILFVINLTFLINAK